ncbi:hypothetical protein [Paenibacillus sp. DCT19]|uniref:hypothetical protein n=1 Tax=Paenibacillus sp. DCT19 TaxID=2211212 RepID=UPI000FE21531|nr:hypothetical protein [Paenibacillus sp. DCT19]
MKLEQMKQISLRGRVAYGICCFENVLITLECDLNDWRNVLNYLWQFTSTQYLDDWNEIIVELIPENLMEFDTYEEQEFERLSRDEFVSLSQLYQSTEESIGILLREIYELGISHAYSVIEGYGESSLILVQRIADYMLEHSFPLPNVDPFLKYAIEENRGWGNRFDGTALSKVIHK